METNGKIQKLQLPVTPEVSISAEIGIPEWWPSGHRTGVVLAHDSRQDMSHPLLGALQQSLAGKGYLTVRFNFPFAQEKKKRPDALPVLERTYRTAVQALLRDPEESPAQLVFAGFGLGARVASHVIASGVKADGLVCLSYPLHPAGKPSQQKNEALFRIICPILFVQGSRDPLCKIERLELLRRRIGAPTQLHVVDEADHALHPLKRSGRSDEEVQEEVLGTVSAFLEKTTGS